MPQRDAATAARLGASSRTTGRVLDQEDGTVRIGLAVLGLAAVLVGCADSPSARSEAEAPLLTGVFSYLADAALFTDCADHARYPVAMEAGYLDLERAYLAVRRFGGEPILVTLRGDREPRPAMDGDAVVTTLVVRQFVSCYPGESCGNPGATARLTNSYWKLTRLDGGPVPRRAWTVREPHLILRTEDGRLTGSTGCNTFSGDFQHEGPRLTLGVGVVTLAACPDDGALEQQFLQALGRTAAWRIDGVHLDLLDDAGVVVARFEDTLP